MPSTFKGYIDPNWPPTGAEGDSRFIIYGYTPSAVLAILAIVLFALSSAAHTYQLFRYRAFYFSVPMVLGCVFEIIGYIARTLSAKKNPYRLIFFILQYFFVVVAPVFFSASIYAVLSFLINSTSREYSPVFTPKVIVALFVTSDVIATIVQVAGAALIGSAESNGKSPVTANNILLAGLAFQVASFCLYLVLLSIFLQRAWKVLSARKGMKLFLGCYLVATIMIYLRTCFRLAETSEGVFGKLMTHEVYFGCLEFMPVIVAVLLFNLSHPGRIVKGKTGGASDGGP